jgi:hypothetical protein
MSARETAHTKLDLRDAAGLAVLAPLVAETVASSNTPAILFPIVLPLLVLVYGLPALLIRELWMRGRIGWPGFVVLGMAYTALNEGVIAATWFKISPEHEKVLVFTAEQAGRVHGVNLAVALNLTVYHTIWSMLIPIVLMEAWTRRGRGRPWLPRWAFGVAAAVVGFIVVGSMSDNATDKVCDASSSVVFDECAQGRRGSALFIVVAIVVALLLPRLRPHRGATQRPGDRALVWIGIGYSIAFLVSYFILPLSDHAVASEVMAVVLLVTAITAVLTWWRAPTWDLHAAVLLATGAMIPGMLASIKGVIFLQPVAVALFVWFFLRPTLRRTRELRGYTRD